MKENRKLLIAVLILVAIPFIASLLVYNRLPEPAVIHWGASGQPNGYATRFSAAFSLPFVILGVNLLFLLIPIIDPLRSNIMQFIDYYNGFVIFFDLVMVVVHIWSLLWNIGIKINPNFVIPVLVGALFYFLGIVLQHVKKNWFIGIRTPWTLSSDAVWEKTHKLGSVLFKICGVILILSAFFPKYAFFFILIPLLSVSVILTVYSYVEYQAQQKKMS